MTKEELNAQIKKSFDMSKMTTVIVGDKAMIEQQLERFSKDAKTKDDLNNVKLKKITVD